MSANICFFLSFENNVFKSEYLKWILTFKDAKIHNLSLIRKNGYRVCRYAERVHKYTHFRELKFPRIPQAN